MITFVRRNPRISVMFSIHVNFTGCNIKFSWCKSFILHSEAVNLPNHFVNSCKLAKLPISVQDLSFSTKWIFLFLRKLIPRYVGFSSRLIFIKRWIQTDSGHWGKLKHCNWHECLGWGKCHISILNVGKLLLEILTYSGFFWLHIDKILNIRIKIH